PALTIAKAASLKPSRRVADLTIAANRSVRTAAILVPALNPVLSPYQIHRAAHCQAQMVWAFAAVTAKRGAPSLNVPYVLVLVLWERQNHRSHQKRQKGYQRDRESLHPLHAVRPATPGATARLPRAPALRRDRPVHHLSHHCTPL